MKKLVSIIILISLLGCEKTFTFHIPYTQYGKMVFNSDNITGGYYPDCMEFGIGVDSLNNTAFLIVYLKPQENWKIKKIRTRFSEGDYEQDTLHPSRNSSTLQMTILANSNKIYTKIFTLSFHPDSFLDIDIDPPVALNNGITYRIKFFVDDDGDSTPYTPDSIPYAYFSFDYSPVDTGNYYFMWYKMSSDSQVIDSQKIIIPMEIYQ